MRPDAQSGITTLLENLRDGDADARSRLLQQIYDELRPIAAMFLRDKGSDVSLQPREVVNDAYIRLFGKDFKPQNRAQTRAEIARLQIAQKTMVQPNQVPMRSGSPNRAAGEFWHFGKNFHLPPW